MNFKQMTLFLTVFLLSPSIVLSQTVEQRRELDQINRDIAADEREIAIATAQTLVDEFFINKFGYIHQTNGDCLRTVNQIESYAEQLGKSVVFSEKYTNSEQAYAAMEVLADTMIREDLILNKIQALQEHYEIQKSNINSMKEFLLFGPEWVYSRFPKPDDVADSTSYYKALWTEYQSIVTQHGEKLKYYASKCGDSKFDVSADIVKRRDIYKDFNKKLTEFYLEAYKTEYANRIISKYKPSENTKILLAINSAFNNLDRKYQSAIMLEFDYFKAVSIIESYPNISAIILAKASPRELNPEIREEVEGEIERRIAKAEKYKKIIQKEKPSYWLNKKYIQVKSQVDSGQINCEVKCKRNLDQVIGLIHASQILEDISNETVYAMLGYQALDLVTYAK